MSYEWRALGATAQGKWSFNVGRSRPNGRTEGETPKKVAFRAQTTVEKCRTYSLIPFILQALWDFTTNNASHLTPHRGESDKIGYHSLYVISKRHSASFQNARSCRSRMHGRNLRLVSREPRV